MNAGQEECRIVKPVDKVASKHKVIAGEFRLEVARVPLMKCHPPGGIFKAE